MILLAPLGSLIGILLFRYVVCTCFGLFPLVEYIESQIVKRNIMYWFENIENW